MPVFVRPMMDDEINYRYGTGPKPPHLSGGSGWGPPRHLEPPIIPIKPPTPIVPLVSPLSGICTCYGTCICGHRRF